MEIIAEIGQNHNGDMDLAIKMIRRARECGADVAKFQLYNARELFPREGNEWYEYNCRTEISRRQLSLLVEACAEIGIEFMASAFDPDRVAWLEEVGVKRYKLASRSIYNRELIDVICRTGKTIIASLGMWEGKKFPVIESEVPVKFLYCVAEYPARAEDLKLGRIDFNHYAGFSDHSIGITAAIVAFARGAEIIEKHFTLDKKMYGPDHAGSMTPDELSMLHEFRLNIEKCL